MIIGFLWFLGGRQQVQAGEIEALHLINLLTLDTHMYQAGFQLKF